MPIFEVEHPYGRRFELDAPNQDAAIKAWSDFAASSQKSGNVSRSPFAVSSASPRRLCIEAVDLPAWRNALEKAS